MTRAMNSRWGLSLALIAIAPLAWGADSPIPHGQQAPPGPALTPEEAMTRMTVPEGFHVELVASEPDIVNPVAMTFDERGRIWITESFEYPRREPGVGRDRVKILEDTDGDGKADKFTVFAEGLNIPSGIAVGAGGVWVANSPDILFMKDTDGDDRADESEVVVTGFGREDTHELPNSLTWGPDGWLYGLNGVFNHSRVEQNGTIFEFTCALFRIHPRTREFQLFAEGTSNPWGVAFDDEGSAFVSACVIDHLWHLTETGYYHRQGGPYPPYVWKIESIVDYRHQQAAYCGIHYYDSDVYPEAYRRRLYMGNIHGGCVNRDVLERNGSTYRGAPEDDFLSAHDAWFMPVAQKTGPDGCLYVLDWYDRYHCYQDANRDPEGIDRGKGRLYRVRYGDSPRAGAFDLGQAHDEKLVELLGSGNGYLRDQAQRLLRERANKETSLKLEKLALDGDASRVQRLGAVWTLIGMGPLRQDFVLALMEHDDPGFRAWGARAAGNEGRLSGRALAAFIALAKDPSPDVRLQVVIAAGKIKSAPALDLWFAALEANGDDGLIPRIVWRNLEPRVEEECQEVLARLEAVDPAVSPAAAALAPRLLERILGRKKADPQAVARLTKLVLGAESWQDLGAECLSILATKTQDGEIRGAFLESLKKALMLTVQKIIDGESDHPATLQAALLAASWRNKRGIPVARKALATPGRTEGERLRALEALVAAGDSELGEILGKLLASPAENSLELRRRVLDSMGRQSEPEIAEIALSAYPTMEPELRPQAIELLTGRSGWSRRLLAEIAAGKIPKEAVNMNQVRKLLAGKDEELADQVTSIWGTLRAERSPARERVIAETRDLIRGAPGDPLRGEVVFLKVCGQCHKIHGKGQDVGPDITVNGRGSFAQLLSNVFDPSLVIGAAFQARTVITTDGRILTGLTVEDSEKRIRLKVQGGKTETIAREDIDETEISKLSLMPEDLEKQLKPNEICDLFAFLTLDKHPSDPLASRLPGTLAPRPRETTDPAEFDALVADVAPGFHVEASGEGGLAIEAEVYGREGALRTHPIDRQRPCVLSTRRAIPAGMKTRLLLEVSHHDAGDWRLTVKANGETLHDSIIGAETTVDGWTQVEVDLSKFGGQEITLEIANAANGWSNEFGYWGAARIASE